MFTDRNNIASFEELLNKNSSVTVHHKNLQLIATEIFKIRNNLALDITKDVFQFKDPTYDLHSNVKNFWATYHVLNSIRCLAPKIWKQVPKNKKSCGSLMSFKQLIKTWIPNRCSFVSSL